MGNLPAQGMGNWPAQGMGHGAWGIGYLFPGSAEEPG